MLAQGQKTVQWLTFGSRNYGLSLRTRCGVSPPELNLKLRIHGAQEGGWRRGGRFCPQRAECGVQWEPARRPDSRLLPERAPPPRRWLVKPQSRFAHASNRKQQQEKQAARCPRARGKEEVPLPVKQRRWMWRSGKQLSYFLRTEGANTRTRGRSQRVWSDPSSKWGLRREVPSPAGHLELETFSLTLSIPSHSSFRLKDNHSIFKVPADKKENAFSRHSWFWLRQTNEQGTQRVMLGYCQLS